MSLSRKSPTERERVFPDSFFPSRSTRVTARCVLSEGVAFQEWFVGL